MEENFKVIVLEAWTPFDFESRIPIAFQFAANHKNIKKLTSSWAQLKHQMEEVELKEVEEDLDCPYEDKGHGFLSQDSEETLWIYKKGRSGWWRIEKKHGGWRVGKSSS